MSEKHSLQKQIKKQKNKYLQRFKLADKENTSNEVQNAQKIIEVSPDNNIVNEQIEIKEETFKQKLKKIMIKHKISRNFGDDLLKILPRDLKCPRTTKALFSYKKNCLVIRTVASGQYIHFGISVQLQKLNSILEGETSIVIDIGIDGLPLFKSSHKSLWPILGKTVNLQKDFIFIIGAFYGNGKPLCINTYLHDFTEELKNLKNYGFICNGQVLNFSIRAFICDAPAKAFVTGTVGHNAFHGCSRCTQIGKKVNRVTVYSSKVETARTNESFKSRFDPEHHIRKFQSEFSNLEALGINMISQFPIDPMHLIDLGVTRKILRLIYKKLDKNSKNSLNEKMIELSKHSCKEFARKPRSFEELNCWKATEFRQFLLYTGVVVLKDVISDDEYYHFLLLHAALRFLFCPHFNQNNVDTVQNLINDFVLFFSTLYGEDTVTYNVHTLLHIVECVVEIGHITEFTAFAFENYMQKIKKNIKKPNKVLEQLKNCFYIKAMELHDQNVPSEGPGVWILIAKSFGYFNTKTFEKYVLLQNSEAKQIIKVENENIICKALVALQDFFDMPVPSSKIGIYKWDGVVSNVETTHNKRDIYCKYVCLPHNNSFVLFPILHNCL